MHAGFDDAIECHLSAAEPEVLDACRALARPRATTCSWLAMPACATTAPAGRTTLHPGLVDAPRSPLADLLATARHGPRLHPLTLTTTPRRRLPRGVRRPALLHLTITGGRHEAVTGARSGFSPRRAPRAARRGGGRRGPVAAAIPGTAANPLLRCPVRVRRGLTGAWGAGGALGSVLVSTC